ncbi:MAG TPA: nucleoside phosphorylase [Cyclobacteriaceae bacterium]|nr:nucleoside phosphorylase [Cyclobacteriaceae bacterium]
MSAISATDLILNPDGSVYHLNLLPEHIADDVIAVGDPDRVAMVTKYFDKIEFEINKREFVTQVGTYKGKRITVISTGIGTDNVEIFFNELDALVNIDLQKRAIKAQHRKLNIIRIGTSGTLQEDIPVGAQLVSRLGIGLDNLMNFYEISYSEFESNFSKAIQEHCNLDFLPYTVACSDKLYKHLAADMLEGNTLTAPGFYAPQGRKLRLHNRYPDMLNQLRHFQFENIRLTNFEMETSAYYALGRLLGHEVLSTNAIVANRVKQEFAKDPYKVVDELIFKVLEAL